MLMTYEMLRNSLTKYKAPDIKIKRMSDKNEIVKITKNLYETDKNTPGYLVANAIYSPSYLSFDYAMAYHGLIPETVYVYTSATFKKRKKKEYHNSLGTFTYCDDSDKRRGIGHVPVMEVDEPSGVHVAHPAFEVEMFYPFGIEIISEGNRSYTIATPEKALCDKLYSLKPIRTKKAMKELLFNDLRIDIGLFKRLNFNDLNTLCDLYKTTNMRVLKKVIGDFNENNS